MSSDMLVIVGGCADLMANCNEICRMISQLTGLPLPTEARRN